MRKAADSLATTIDPVKPELAIDLGGDQFLKGMKRRRKLAAFQADVDREVARLTQRAIWLTKTSRRLPVNSNGRKKRRVEAITCGMLARFLTDALGGKAVPKIPMYTSGHIGRAARLLNDMHTAVSA